MAEGDEEGTIGGLPARPGDLLLQDPELVSEGENLGAKPGLGLAANHHGVQEETGERVEEGEDHQGIMARGATVDCPTGGNAPRATPQASRLLQSS